MRNKFSKSEHSCMPTSITSSSTFNGNFVPCIQLPSLCDWSLKLSIDVFFEKLTIGGLVKNFLIFQETKAHCLLHKSRGYIQTCNYSILRHVLRFHVFKDLFAIPKYKQTGPYKREFIPDITFILSKTAEVHNHHLHF